MTLEDSTLAGNSVAAGSGGAQGAADGAAVYNLAYGNNIYSGNATSASAILSGDSLSNNSGGNNPLVNVNDSSNAVLVNLATSPATSVAATSATLNGTVNAGSDSNTLTVSFQLSTISGDYTNSTTFTASPGTVSGTTDTPVSADATGLTLNTTYYYRLAVTSSVTGLTYYSTEESFTTQASPVFSNLTSPSIVYGTATTTLGGHLSDGSRLPLAGEQVFVTVNGVTQTGTLDANGNFSIAFPTATLGVANSPYTVTYSYAGDGNFTSASDSSTTMMVTKATPTVSWSNPASIPYGTPLSSTQLDATASVPGTFRYTPAAGTVPGSGLQMLQVVFTPSDTADYNSVTALAMIDVGSASTPPPSPSGTSQLLYDEVSLAIDLALLLDGYPLTPSLDSAINGLLHDIASNPTLFTPAGMFVTEAVLATYGVL